jgi:Limiting CO2-inducible proteins B/C beta carbonyic anhydrases
MNNEHLNTVRKWYPRALTSIDTVNRLLDTIEKHLGLKPHQLMHADSMCCDDVNAIQYPPRAYEMLGPFHLGGLDGFPFAGITGMNAFAHHVPENGAVIIFYAPHIGITKDGTIGEISRIGQSKNSACCGAAKGALNKLFPDEHH